MKEATGSTVTWFFILMGIVITMGYLAFNINYTKAFRMKDKIIAMYNDRKGNCDSTCQTRINEYAMSIGYSTDNTIDCTGYDGKYGGLYCYSKVISNKQSSAGAIKDEKDEYYYKIATKIHLEIPVISNILNFKVFYITGDTKLFKEE